MAFAGDAAVVHRDEPIRITLLFIDKVSYQIVEYLTCETKIENVSSRSQLIPWDPNIPDVEPKNPTLPYEYESLDISLWFTNRRNQIEVRGQLRSTVHQKRKGVAWSLNLVNRFA